MSNYEHPKFPTHYVIAVYDGIFDGVANLPGSKLPFKYASVPLNGTDVLSPEDAEDKFVGTRFGVFVEPYEPALDLPIALVDETHVLPYEIVLETVMQAKIAEQHYKNATNKLVSAKTLRGFLREVTGNLRIPIGVITGWRHTEEDMPDSQLCLHYPAIAHPESILAYLGLAAARELKLENTRDAIPISFVPKAIDATSLFSGGDMSPFSFAVSTSKTSTMFGSAS